MRTAASRDARCLLANCSDAASQDSSQGVGAGCDANAIGGKGLAATVGSPGAAPSPVAVALCALGGVVLQLSVMTREPGAAPGSTSASEKAIDPARSASLR